MLFIAIIGVFSSFTQKSKEHAPTFCGPQFQVGNWGKVYIESVHLYNAYGDDERIYDIAPNLITSTTTFSLSLTTVKLLLETPQQGSIKTYNGRTLKEYIPSSSSNESRYDFHFQEIALLFIRSELKLTLVNASCALLTGASSNK